MMKSVFCLALVCCFVAGALAAGCGCDEGVFDCACKNANDEGKIMIILNVFKLCSVLKENSRKPFL